VPILGSLGTPVRSGFRDDEVALHDNSEVDRHAVEQFIKGRFHRAFGSRVEAFMPRLFSLRDAEGLILGAFGLRGAAAALFLEQYLDASIESEITSRTGVPCARRGIVEVGHLSGAHAGVVRTMIGLLTRRLHEEGIRWVTFTGTASLRNAFHRLSLSPVEIAVARIERLPQAERPAWGRYYDDAPRVFFGNVQEGYRMLGPCPSRRAGLMEAAR
jgi:hypothetical protein